MDNISYAGFELAVSPKAEKALGTAAQELGFANIEAFLYVFDYGFRQALADPIAGLRRKMEQEKDDAGNAANSEADIEAALLTKQEKRFTDLLAGTVGSRASGPRLKPLDKLAFDNGVEQLKRVYAKLNRKFPSGEGAAESIRHSVATLWADEPRFKARAYSEAQRKLDSDAELLADFNVSGLNL